MTEQSANSQDSAHTGWPTPAPTSAVSIGASGNRTTRSDHCPECGEHVLQQMDVCPACGGNLRQSPKQIRCMHCNTTASSELVVCPGCGRELREAPPKVITYGAPVVVALLFAILIITQWRHIAPIAWARTNLLRGVTIVQEVSSSIEPEMVIVMTPVVEGMDNTSPGSVTGNGSNLAQAAVAENVVVSETQAVALGPSVVTPIPDASAKQVAAMPVSTTLEAAESPVGIGGPEPTRQNAPAVATPESLPTATTTDTPVPTATAKPTSMPAAYATNSPMPTPTWTLQATATSKSTESVLSPTPTVKAPAAKAAAGGIAQIAAIAASAATTETVALPTATAILVATPMPTPTATPLVYQIKAGDTLVTIAAKYHVDVDALMAANQISAQGVFVIQPGEMLFIPTPAPMPTPATVRVEAPVLLEPPDNAAVGCATGGDLIWQRVQLVKDSDKYLLHLGFVNGKDDNGQEKVTWVLAQSGPVTQTSWRLDTSLCDLAAATSDHQWRWWVEVVEDANGGVAPVSPPSQVFRFVWK